MNNCLVTVVDPAEGFRSPAWRGMSDYARAIHTGDWPADEPFDMEDNEQKIMRRVKMWSCDEKDIPIVLEKMSREWVGYELKVFTLTHAATRIPGELKEKQLTKDGVLPK
jgi:hypothetical protein